MPVPVQIRTGVCQELVRSAYHTCQDPVYPVA